MATLSLFRHAKSAWDDPGLSDFERPLAPRGEEAAPLMGRTIAEAGLVPEIVMCSPAARARQTCELAMAQWSDKPECRYEDDLYMASPAAMLALVARVPVDCSHVMLVGHNPGMYALAVNLAQKGDELSITRLREKFPTAALAVFHVSGDWGALNQSDVTLERFVTPKSLA